MHGRSRLEAALGIEKLVQSPASSELPWIFQYSDDNAATVISIVLGIGLIAYSLLTNYELGLWKVAPMAVHNVIDIVAGALLAVSPWIFGFADDGTNFCAAGGSPPRS